MEDLVDRAFWRDRPTLVTGATGLVGGTLVRDLLAAGADLVALVRDWVPMSELARSGRIEAVKVVRGDFTEPDLVERALGEYEIDTVFHLGAQTLVPVANRNPLSTFESNIAGTWRLLEAARRSPKVKAIVLASSDKAYGEQKILPYTEETPLQGRHPYDVSKSCADLIAQAYAHTFRQPVIITRCGNLYGPGDLNWNRIIPGTIRSVLRGQRPLIRSDGSPVRDYFHADDAARAYETCARALHGHPDLAGQAFNFSNDQPLSVLEVTRRILKAMGSRLEPDIRNEAVGEIQEQYLGSAKARSVLGWRPTLDFETGLQRTLPWYRELLGQGPR